MTESNMTELYTISFGDDKTGEPKGCITKALPLDQAVECLTEQIEYMQKGDEQKFFIWREN